MGDALRFFHPVLASSALRRGPVRVTVGGRHVALFRDAAGAVGALDDRCPHRFSPLSAGRVRPDGRLACAYHGWSFDKDGGGRSPSQPTLTRCDVRALRAVERHDTIFIAERHRVDEAPLATPSGAAPETLPELGVPPGHTFAGRMDLLFQAPLHVLLDNFGEDEHTPWVHTRLGWTERDVDTIHFEAHNHPDHTEVKYAARQRYSPLAHLVGLKRGDTFHNEWTTWFDPVRTLYTQRWTDPATGARRPVGLHAAIFKVPETPRTTRLQVLLFAAFEGPFALARPILARLALGLVWSEMRDDQRFVPVVADTPLDLRGMRLGKFDKPLIHNRRLLRKIYLGEAERPEDRADAADASAQGERQRESTTDSP